MKACSCKKRGCLHTYHRAFSHIHLVDRCLLIFMAVLLLQTAYTLFAPGGGTELEHIDVVIRTATAGIFGYFLSANFIRHAAQEVATPPSAPPLRADSPVTGGGVPVGQIGFAAVSPQPESGGADAQGTSQAEAELLAAGRLQILVAAGIGLFSLVLLMLVRNFAPWQESIEGSSTAVATVAQLRDLVSGCVGFLIGSPTGGGKGA